jgi:hypothetical protein
MEQETPSLCYGAVSTVTEDQLIPVIVSSDITNPSDVVTNSESRVGYQLEDLLLPMPRVSVLSHQKSKPVSGTYLASYDAQLTDTRHIQRLKHPVSRSLWCTRSRSPGGVSVVSTEGERLSMSSAWVVES